MWSRGLVLAALAGLAALINLNAPTVFFDSQLMLGTAVAVLALLVFRWSGLVVGAAALAVTAVRWGHPYELLIGMGLLIWLRWFLDRCNGGVQRQGNGRLVMAAIGYWLVLGIPAELLLFTLRLGIDPVKGLALGLKEAVVSVLSVGLGLVAYGLWSGWRWRGCKGRISVRGLTFAVVLLGVSVPGVLITFILSGQLKTTALRSQFQAMEHLARDTAQAGRPPEPLPGQSLALGWRTASGRWASTDPGLFDRLAHSYRREPPSRTGLAELELWVPSRVVPVLQADQRAYWRVRSGPVTVLQPADPLIRQLDHELLLVSFSLLGALLLLASALAEALAGAVERQFLGVIRPLQGQLDSDHLPALGNSAIRELQVLVDLVNRRTRRTRELTTSLRQVRDELAQTALAITEAIPVGTYTMVLRPGARLARFSFMSERFLQICGVKREVAAANPLRVFACVHPDDHASWMALHAQTFAGKLPFKGQCRVVVKDAVRWIQAEAIPRALPDGSTVWEGVIADISERVQAEQQLRDREQELRHILSELPIPVGCNLLSGRQQIVFLNQRFLDTFGYDPGELPDLETWAERAYPDPAYRRQVMQLWTRQVQRSLSEGKEVEPIELEVVCKDGSRRNVILSASFRDDRMVAAFLDVTERKRAEAALEQAFRREAALKERQRLELEAKLRSSLTAAAVAHEINQPLSSILVNAQLLQGQLEALPEGEGRSALQHLLALQISESERIVTTIEKMRMLLRNVQTDHQRIDLCEVVSSAQLYLRGLLHSHGVTLETWGLDQPRWLLGDAAQLQIAVANLIRNAVEACSQAEVPSPRLRLSLEQCVTADPAAEAPGGGGAPGGFPVAPEGSVWLDLRLADNGSGFSDVQLEQLLLVSTKPEGSGIGLYVANTTAQIHGGSLRLGRSAELGGGEVLLRLPALV